MDRITIQKALQCLGVTYASQSNKLVGFKSWDAGSLADDLAPLLNERAWTPVRHGYPTLGSRSVIWKHKNGVFHMGGSPEEIKQNAVAWFEFDDYVEPKSPLVQAVEKRFRGDNYSREEIIDLIMQCEKEIRS